MRFPSNAEKSTNFDASLVSYKKNPSYVDAKQSCISVNRVASQIHRYVLQLVHHDPFLPEKAKSEKSTYITRKENDFENPATVGHLE